MDTPHPLAGLSVPRAFPRSSPATGEGDGAPCGATSFVCGTRPQLPANPWRRSARHPKGLHPSGSFAAIASARSGRSLGVGPRFAGGICAPLSASSSRPAHSGQAGGTPTPPGSAAAWPRARAPHSRWRDFPGPRPRKSRRRISGVRSSGCPTCTTPHEAPLGGQVTEFSPKKSEMSRGWRTGCPHGEERGVAARLEPCRPPAGPHPSRRRTQVGFTRLAHH